MDLRPPYRHHLLQADVRDEDEDEAARVDVLQRAVGGVVADGRVLRDGLCDGLQGARYHLLDLYEDGATPGSRGEHAQEGHEIEEEE